MNIKEQKKNLSKINLIISFLFILFFGSMLLPNNVLASNCCEISTITVGINGFPSNPVNSCKDDADVNKETCVNKTISNANSNANQTAVFFENSACNKETNKCVVGSATATTEKKVELRPIKFKFNIPLPGLPQSFIVDSIKTDGIDNYIAWLYRFVVGIAGLLAVFMITVGGLIWIFAGGNGSKISKAREYITGAVIGLLLAIFSYSILYIINPQLVLNKFPQLKPIDKVEIEDVYTNVAGNLSNVGNVGDASYYCTPMANIKGIPVGLKCNPEDARKLGEWLYKDEICVGACHCAWSVSAFLQYLGCKSPFTVSAPGLADAAKKQGWQAIPYNRNIKDDFIGILYMNGHVGLYLGKGMAFQSGGLHPKVKHVPQSTVINKDLPCSKVPGHLVKDGLYMAGRGGVASCSTVQAWVYHKVNENYGSSGWETIYKLPSNATTGGSGADGCKNPPKKGAAGLSGGTGN